MFRLPEIFNVLIPAVKVVVKLPEGITVVPIVTEAQFKVPEPLIVADVFAPARLLKVTASVTFRVTPVTVKMGAVDAVPNVNDFTVAPAPLKVGWLV